MASSKAPAKSGRQDATQILAADHKKVSKIFAEFEKIKDRDSEGKQQLVKKACDELTVHAQVEEEIFYPALHEALKESDQDLVDEAEVEHASIKQLIETLKTCDPEDRHYDASVMVLSEYVKHHVKEEQDEIFPKARKAKDLDLKQMGEEIMARKMQLMEEHGMEMEDMPASRKRQPASQRHA
ncbi:MAG TPA: hemerythrin domain-containing protein [Burkholderiales bacterium]|nr:hemerythrin domain-containing protein [Burkholderiales bacterium]